MYGNTLTDLAKAETAYRSERLRRGIAEQRAQRVARRRRSTDELRWR